MCCKLCHLIWGYDGFIGQKILKLWRQESRPFSPGWAANIPRISSCKYKLWSGCLLNQLKIVTWISLMMSINMISKKSLTTMILTIKTFRNKKMVCFMLFHKLCYLKKVVHITDAWNLEFLVRSGKQFFSLTTVNRSTRICTNHC